LFIVPQNKDLKRLVRTRMAESGENYTQALAHIQADEQLDPLPDPWFLTGRSALDYQVGLVPGEFLDGSPVARLRLRPGVTGPTDFGALMQSIAATRYAGRRVRFSAQLRGHAVTGWAGLWLRVDGDRRALILDNMQDRPVRQTTDWAEASIVLDVASEATSLHFGMLLSGAGAVDLARPAFGEASPATPVTAVPDRERQLPDEPQALDFG
jgi:hypothetical protein